MSGIEPSREREELVRALSLRFGELRLKAEMTQKDVAEAMGHERNGIMLVSRAEHGAVANASLCSVAEHLRAVRAGFGSLKDVLDRYTSVPIPRPALRRAKAAPPPRTQAGGRTLALPPGAGHRALALHSRQKEPPDLETVRVQRRAGYWVLRKVFEHFLHSELHAIRIPPASWVRRCMAQYGRKVFNGLFRTRGPKEPKRPERLARLREWALKQHLPEPLAEYMEFATSLTFDDMREHDELDWLPPPAEAYAITALKPKRRVVTDAQMCLEEWWDAYNRSARAGQEVGERAHKAASGVLAAAGGDAATAGGYVRATNWAMNMGCYSAPGTPERKRSVAEFLAAPWMAQLDRKLLERLLSSALEVWDEARPTLPPPPGPKPH
jgi:hypothetical protein